jgi:2-hydroxychromene-2-carboxylate isomerase
MRTIHFWFDYSCPYAYLGSTQVEALAARAGAALVWEPMLLGGVFKANDTPQNLMNILSPAKATHNANDMMRWAELFGVPLVMPSGHPLRTVEALRATLASGIDPKVVHGFYRAYWIEGRAPSDPATMRDVLLDAGHDADSLLTRLDGFRDELRARTDRAISLGIFGAPSFVVSTPGETDRMFWGQDRLDFVERVASGRPLRSMGA